MGEAQYRSCCVRLKFADGEYNFRLTLKWIAELQELREAPIGQIYERVMMGRYYQEDLYETVRCGLIGGGDVDAQRARSLIDRYCGDEQMPLNDWLTHARAILLGCVVGYDPPDEEKGPPPGEAEAGSILPEQSETVPLQAD